MDRKREILKAAQVGSTLVLVTNCSYHTIAGCRVDSVRIELARATKVSRSGEVKAACVLDENWDRKIHGETTVYVVSGVDCLDVAQELSRLDREPRFDSMDEAKDFLRPFRKVSA